MSATLHGLAMKWLATGEVVPISQCVHFCGFRYGRGELNPYEQYVVALVQGVPREQARARFVDFLLNYRPRHFGEALSIVLSRDYPLWFYPWSRQAPAHSAPRAGWLEDPDACPDILTHFSERGILIHRIEEEFRWLERALESIRQHGYAPDKFGSRIAALRLKRTNGQCSYLLLDGNHRAASLSALGHEQVEVNYLKWQTVNEATVAQWPQVRQGRYTERDALSVFNVYFDGNLRHPAAAEPARLLDGAA